MAGKFEVFMDKGGEFRFRLKAANGEIVLSSEGYSRKPAALNGIESVKANAGNAAMFESAETGGGKYRFSLKAKNRQTIGTSGNYASATGRNRGIAAVGRAAVGAKVVDLTLK